MIKHEYLQSRACLYMFVTFITVIIIPFYQIMDYRDTRAYILDPCIQEFYLFGLAICTFGKENFAQCSAASAIA